MKLATMVKAIPVSLHNFGNIPGIGEAKLKQFGAAFVNLFTSFRQEGSKGNSAESGKKAHAPREALLIKQRNYLIEDLIDYSNINLTFLKATGENIPPLG
jgi:hypothetical protein